MRGTTRMNPASNVQPNVIAPFTARLAPASSIMSFTDRSFRLARASASRRISTCTSSYTSSRSHDSIAGSIMTWPCVCSTTWYARTAMRC